MVQPASTKPASAEPAAAVAATEVRAAASLLVRCSLIVRVHWR
jgi:hypothetical protein